MWPFSLLESITLNTNLKVLAVWRNMDALTNILETRLFINGEVGSLLCPSPISNPTTVVRRLHVQSATKLLQCHRPLSCHKRCSCRYERRCRYCSCSSSGSVYRMVVNTSTDTRQDSKQICRPLRRAFGATEPSGTCL